MDLGKRRYKEGDVVVYIGVPNNMPEYLTYGKSYVISVISHSNIIWIINDIDKLDYFSNNKFIGKDEYRDNVINEILM